MKQSDSLLPVFRSPLILAIFSLVGLLSALLGDDFWDALSWFALGAPVAVIVWCIALRRRGVRDRVSSAKKYG